MWSAVSPSGTDVGGLGSAQDRGFQFPDIHIVLAVAIIAAAQGICFGPRFVLWVQPAQDDAGAYRSEPWPLATVYSPDMTGKDANRRDPTRARASEFYSPPTINGRSRQRLGDLQA
jgi:hypothetical protein